MTSRRLVCIGGGLDPGEVSTRIAEGRVDALVYYPYYCFLARVRTRSLSYLLDARRGGLSTCDPFTVERREAPERDVLPASLDPDQAARLARRYIPGRVVADKGLLHKPFWVMSSDSRRFLVDALSARVHPLPTA